MNYLKYIQDALGEEILVTEELNYEYSGIGTICVIKYLAGSNFLDSTVVPVQLAVYTDDMPSTKTLLETFTKTYNDIPYIDGLEYVRQYYSTPFLLSAVDKTGTNYTSQFLVSGTLVISSNVSDIKIVNIDGKDYQTTTRIISYVGYPDSKRSGGKINNTNITNGLMKFSCSLINKGNELGEKLRRIRTGQLDLNTTFEIKLTFTDNNFVETYIMKVDSVSFNSENQLLPVLSMSFIE